MQYPDGSERVVAGRSPQRLLLFLALHDGAADYEQAIRTIWPDVDLATGRRRLRAALAQLHGRGGAVVVRLADRLLVNDGRALVD